MAAKREAGSLRPSAAAGSKRRRRFVPGSYERMCREKTLITGWYEMATVCTPAISANRDSEAQQAFRQHANVKLCLSGTADVRFSLDVVLI